MMHYELLTPSDPIMLTQVDDGGAAIPHTDSNVTEQSHDVRQLLVLFPARPLP